MLMKFEEQDKSSSTSKHDAELLAIGKEIGSVIREQMKSGEAPVTEVAMDTGNSELFDQVNELKQYIIDYSESYFK